MISSVSVKNKIEKDYILSGKCASSDKLPTIRELAKEYQVSYVTALEAVRILAQDGKVVKRQGSGVYVSPTAAKNRSKELTKKIGYVTNSFARQNAYGYKILDGIERVTSQRGYRLELANSNFDFEKEKKAVTKLAKAGVDGIVLYPVPERGGECEYLANEFKDIPIVVVDLVQPKMQRPSIIFDNYNAGYEMVKYLCAKGCKRITFLHNVRETINRAVQDRIMGSMRAVEEIGYNEGSIAFSAENWHGESLRGLVKSVEGLMSSQNAPDAIMTAYDIEAANVYSWLMSNGYKVPCDVKLVGFDNIMPKFMPWLNLDGEYCYHWPTTNPDFTRLGEKAAELLLETIASNNETKKEIILPCPVLMEKCNVHDDIFYKLA